MGSTYLFSTQVEMFAEKAKQNIRLVLVVGVQDLNEQLVVNTPVLTGFLRNSWFAGLNTSPAGVAGSAPDSVAMLNLVGSNMQPGDTYYVGNTAPYALRVEYGFVGKDSLGRNYNQRGQFWVRSVAARLSEIFSAAAVKVSSGNYGSSNPGGGGATPLVGFTSG